MKRKIYGTLEIPLKNSIVTIDQFPHGIYW